MATKVFINFPVKDLGKTKVFWEGLGFSFNPQFSDENAACMVVSDAIYAMFLMEPYFKTFTGKEVADAKKTTEVLVALDASSRDEVTRIINKAKDLGATIYSEPKDHGWMYIHNFADLDGHQWEFAYMDETQLPG